MTAYDLIVIGEGLSGLTCAGHAARSGLKVASFEEEFFGGLVVNVAELEGFEDGGGLSGMDFAADMARANGKAGVTSMQQAVTAIRAANGSFEVDADSGTFGARAVVIATGARLKKLGLPAEESLEGKGVSHCADCDGPLFRGADVVVVGGGDSAFQEALVLARDCASVRMIHRGNRPRARAHFIDAVNAEPKIAVIADATVEAILGSEAVTGVRVRRADGGAEEMACKGVFTYIGLEANSAIAPLQIPRDAEQRLIVDNSFETALRGIWAIGQVRSGFSGLLRDAVVEARHAADAIRWRLA